MRPALSELLQAVVGRLVADHGTPADSRDVLVVLVLVVGSGGSAAHGDQADGPGTQEAQQFPTIHDVLLWLRVIDVDGSQCADCHPHPDPRGRG
jgi:hypothetical protein